MLLPTVLCQKFAIPDKIYVPSIAAGAMTKHLYTLTNSNHGNRFYLFASGNGRMRDGNLSNFLWYGAGNSTLNSEKAFTSMGSQEL
jgi:hypothetical protein